MSGFFGLLHRRGEGPDSNLCQRLLAAQSYRGPDRQDVWQRECTAIGHNLLTTTAALAREPQPYIDPGQEVVVSADVRLDNRAQLGKELRLSSATLAQAGDAALIAAAWHRWGEACPQYLLGDFAFVLWDPRRQMLFGARDHLGVKPFYYHLSDTLCLFASCTEVPLAHPAISGDINQQRIADYFFEDMEGASTSATFYTSISRLPPAHSISVDFSGSRCQRYWNPQAQTASSPGNRADSAAEFLDILTDAVGCRSERPEHTGILLSGGVDSAAVACAAVAGARAAGHAPPSTYSGITAAADCSESTAIKALNQRLQLQPRYLQLESRQQTDYQLMLAAAEHCEPFDLSMTMVHKLYANAAGQGVRVMLDGVEGDLPHSLLTDYPATLLRRGNWLRAWQESAGLRHNHYNDTISLAAVLRRTLLPGLVPHLPRSLRRNWLGPVHYQKILAATLLNPDMARATLCEERLLAFRWRHSPGPAAAMEALQRRSLTHPFLTVALERYDRVAANYGIEPRHPLLDKRLVEFSLGLPWQHKVDCGLAKAQLRGAAQLGGVPGSIARAHTARHLGGEFTEQAVKFLDASIETTVTQQREQIGPYLREGLTNPAILPADQRWQLFGLAAWMARH